MLRTGTRRALNADVNLYLADDLLVKMDRATMAHSLEARSPFLDHVLMEYVASLPPSFKLSGSQKKRVLKAACEACYQTPSWTAQDGLLCANSNVVP